MQVLVHCDDEIVCSEELIRRVEGVVVGTLELFGSRIARAEAHLRDLNSARAGDRDKLCSLEATIDGAASVMASHEAATLAEAIHEAADKLKRMVARELQQLETLDNPQTDPSARPL